MSPINNNKESLVGGKFIECITHTVVLPWTNGLLTSSDC